MGKVGSVKLKFGWNLVAVLMVIALVQEKLGSWNWDFSEVGDRGLSGIPLPALYLLGYGLVISYRHVKADR